MACEVRKGIPGGMCTNLDKPKFIEMKASDHNFIIGEMDFKWEPIYDVSYFDLEISIKDAINTGIWKLQKSRKDINKTVQNPKSKIIRNIDLDITPWNILYKHNANKKTNCNINTNVLLFGDAINTKSKAKDANFIPVKWAIDIYNKINIKQKSNLLIAWKNLPKNTKAIMLRKKNKPVNSVLDARQIQICPIHLKILENSRIPLK